MHNPEQPSSPEIPEEQDVKIVDLDQPVDVPSQVTQPASSPLAARFTPRQRRTQLVATVSVILLCLLVFLGSYGPTRSIMLGGIFPSLRPTATLAPGSDRFYIQAHPTWGHLFIDGKSFAHLPVVNQDAPLILGRGQHRFDWEAAPFAAQHCILSVPPSSGQNTCPLSVVTNSRVQPSFWLLTFTASMDLLPQAQRVALTQAIQTALDSKQSSEVVQPGEHYATSDPKHPIAIATQQLRATLHFRIDTDTQHIAFCIDSLFGMPNTSCRINDEDCRLLCETYFPTPSDTPGEWLTFGVIRTSWDYATLDGHVIAQNQPEIADDAGTNEHILPLRIAWNGNSWRVETTFTSAQLPVPNANPVCFPAVDDFQTRGAMTPNIPNSLSYTLQFTSGSVHAAGCLITLKLEQFSAHGSSNSQLPTPTLVSTAYVLQRFGVFLAANASAHSLWPELPIVNNYERNIVQQLQTTAMSSAAIRREE